MKLSIVFPAYNEEKRISHTLEEYYNFYRTLKQKGIIDTEFIVVLNGCTDNTASVVTEITMRLNDIPFYIIELSNPGKGRAIKTGFENSLSRRNDLIGFVDADMATAPHVFYALVENIGISDGIIASRYMPGSQVIPARSKIKRYGSRFIYEKLIWLLFGLNYYDYQCGAKLFTYAAIKKITPYLITTQWAFDVEVLYLCKKFKYEIKEAPTIWYDRHDSKLKIVRNGLYMLGFLFVIKVRHMYTR